MQRLTVGLMGLGRAGEAVARVLADDSRYDLRWIARRQASPGQYLNGHPHIPVVGLAEQNFDQWFDAHPVEAIVDFSQADTVKLYGEAIQRAGGMVVSAISAYTDAHLSYLRELGQRCRVMSSPNITLGINFLLLSAKMLRDIAPFADVEIVEQHFKDKPEVSGTARKIADTLDLDDGQITSLRVGGIVGHHEVIFGFPHQTVRLIHDSIRREAFGTGVAFALQELAMRSPGFYTFDDLLLQKMRESLLNTSQT